MEITSNGTIAAQQYTMLRTWVMRGLSPELLSTVSEAWKSYVHEKVSKGLPETNRVARDAEEDQWPQLAQLAQDKPWKQECSKRDEKFDMHFTAAVRPHASNRFLTDCHLMPVESHVLSYTIREKHLQEGSKGRDNALSLLDDSKDILALSLDALHGNTVTDPSIFRSTAAFWEDQFFNDMDRLRVRRPDTLTRVTEYVPEIVEFVEGIVKNGYAYEVDGSVYFDTRSFDGADNHHYAKLEPWSTGNRELLEEGEGMLQPSVLPFPPLI
ncbi:cysteinyl-tRNA synthetase [Salix suchowensis]|nr:cysteinyl-tRNA synthetase [Salix suchowensis]